MSEKEEKLELLRTEMMSVASYLLPIKKYNKLANSLIFIAEKLPGEITAADCQKQYTNEVQAFFKLFEMTREIDLEDDKLNQLADQFYLMAIKIRAANQSAYYRDELNYDMDVWR